MRAKNRIQLSMHLQPINFTLPFQDVTERFVPLFWVEEVRKFINISTSLMMQINFKIISTKGRNS